MSEVQILSPRPSFAISPDGEIDYGWHAILVEVARIRKSVRTVYRSDNRPEASSCRPQFRQWMFSFQKIFLVIQKRLHPRSADSEGQGNQGREVLRNAMDIQAEYRIQFYDAVIVAAAEKYGCHEIVTEDLNDGQTYHGMLAVNPFAAE